ncbi:uncharacterized protein SETTUDRAFT_32539 [Exserohilum turcica Et28A]|uniref:Uncharacterized protein n=1 Tax=Exserohilum turcicum (strain 28A) TaxID=671987 RepID=R0IKC4_EXST2|nr:uncharacterized protein SETTUDRAFT_32539 [Exserohilum turcica Et28A]EOA85326.1 hypothetical protein SETTUDRAFT_32539 [Exserohilum turcica Et28A]
MKPTFLTSLALVSIFQPMNMLFASAHPSAPASAPAKLELNTKANCYTPPDNGTGCSDDIPYTPAAEDPIRDMCKNDWLVREERKMLTTMSKCSAIPTQAGYHIKITGSV